MYLAVIEFHLVLFSLKLFLSLHRAQIAVKHFLLKYCYPLKAGQITEIHMPNGLHVAIQMARLISVFSSMPGTIFSSLCESTLQI